MLNPKQPDPHALTYCELRALERVVEACEETGRYDEAAAVSAGVRRADFRLAITCGVLKESNGQYLLDRSQGFSKKVAPRVKPASKTTREHQKSFRECAEALSQGEQEMLYELIQHTVNWRNDSNSLCRVRLRAVGDLGYVKDDLRPLFSKLRPESLQVQQDNFTVPRSMRSWVPSHMMGSLVS